MAKTQTKTVTATSTGIAYPNRYNVIIYNDDFTPMEFVIQLLVEIFNKDINTAQEITMDIHNKGKAVAGTYSYEIAEQKVTECVVLCRYNGHQLKIEAEKI